MVLWVRGHTGIPSNEEADKRSDLRSVLANLRGSPEHATYQGVNGAPRAERAKARTKAGFGRRRSNWGRRALSAHTWIRTDWGPRRHGSSS